MNTQANNNGAINLTKAAYDAAKAAGETTATFAVWRAEQKKLASDTGVETTTLPLVTDTPESGEVITPAAVLAKVDDAIDTVQTAQAAAVTNTGVSKSKLAQAIFAEELAKQTSTGVPMVRKDVIARFIAEAGLSKAGANTYYQNIRDKNGLVQHKAA